MSTFTGEDVEALEWGIECAHGSDDDPSATTSQAWRDFTRTALREAEIEVTKAQFTRAWRVMQQQLQEGGTPNDVAARAVLAAMSAPEGGAA